MDDFDEIERLRTWYEYFEKSFCAMEEEITRRRLQDEAISLKVAEISAYLSNE